MVKLYWLGQMGFLIKTQNTTICIDYYASPDPERQKLLEEVRRGRDAKKLTEPLSYRPATEADMDDILRIVGDARASLKKLGVDQWQGEYPQAENFRFDMERGECFVILHGEEIAAFFTLSTRHEETYDAITDGKWTEGLPCCVLHRAAVAKEYRGSGLSGYLLRCVEQQARLWELRCVRTDTHRKNKPMQKLLRENGYRYRGNLQIVCEPGHDSARQGFEKILKK